MQIIEVFKGQETDVRLTQSRMPRICVLLTHPWLEKGD